MASCAKWMGIFLLLAICLAPPAMALKAPAVDTSAPGPRVSQMSGHRPIRSIPCRTGS